MSRANQKIRFHDIPERCVLRRVGRLLAERTASERSESRAKLEYLVGFDGNDKLHVFDKSYFIPCQMIMVVNSKILKFQKQFSGCAR